MTTLMGIFAQGLHIEWNWILSHLLWNANLNFNRDCHFVKFGNIGKIQKWVGVFDGGVGYVWQVLYYGWIIRLEIV